MIRRPPRSTRTDTLSLHDALPIAVTPDPTAPRPRWEKFLADTFAGDPELTIYTQRLLGLSLIGEHLEQIPPFQTGAGANGKSTLMNVAQERKSTRLNSRHYCATRMPYSA